MSPFQLPDDAIPPRCDCDACRDLARCLDADIRARVAVLTAARRVDAVHKLAGKPSPQHAQGGKKS